MSAPDRRPVSRDPKTGQIRGGGASLNPNGSRGKGGHRKEIRKLIGEHGERAYGFLLDVMEGNVSIEVLVREPRPDEDATTAALIPTVTKVPSIRERMDAAIFLAEQLNGRAVSTLEIDVEVGAKPQRDLGRYTEEQLEQLEQLLAVGADTVEGTVVEREHEPAQLAEGGNT